MSFWWKIWNMFLYDDRYRGCRTWNGGDRYRSWGFCTRGSGDRYRRRGLCARGGGGDRTWGGGDRHRGGTARGGALRPLRQPLQIRILVHRISDTRPPGRLFRRNVRWTVRRWNKRRPSVHCMVNHFVRKIIHLLIFSTCNGRLVAGYILIIISYWHRLVMVVISRYGWQFRWGAGLPLVFLVLFWRVLLSHDGLVCGPVCCPSFRIYVRVILFCIYCSFVIVFLQC